LLTSNTGARQLDHFASEIKELPARICTNWLDDFLKVHDALKALRSNLIV
jgi:hypothetical protein